jgi:hypothetical protein
MPKTSGSKSTQSLAVQPLPDNASLENLRKQAKSLLKSVRAQEPEAVARYDAFQPHPGKSKLRSLSGAQLAIARSYGFASWSKLKQHFDVVAEYSSLPDALTASDTSDSLVDRFISLACLNYTNDHSTRRDEARKLLAETSGTESREYLRGSNHWRRRICAADACERLLPVETNEAAHATGNLYSMLPTRE